MWGFFSKRWLKIGVGTAHACVGKCMFHIRVGKKNRAVFPAG